MTRCAPACPVDDAEVEVASRVDGKFRIAMRLLENRQRILFMLLTAGRIAVGFCDLLVAAAMYLLFLLLQGRSPAHHGWWTPKTSLSAALITSSLVVLRALMDIVSARSVCHQIQSLSTDFLLRLTQGYSELKWGRFVERNRTELLNHTIYTAREAAEYYHRCIEMASAVVIVAVMAAALVYQSLMAACAFGLALAAFYGVHRFHIRGRLQVAASSREASLRTLQRNLADMFSSGKEIRTYWNHAFFYDRIRRQAERVAVSTLRTMFLPQIARIVSDQGAVLLFLCIIIAVQLRQGDARQLLSLLVFYFVLSRRLLPLISQASLIAGQMESSYENIKIVDSELNECRRHRALALPTLLPDADLVAELDHVSFSFCEGTPILRNVNLSLHEGEIVVVHGASGIGKSSLLNLIAGVSEPVTGVVRADRTNIAYVPQEIPLLDDSIRNNLLFGLPEKSDEDLMRALAVASLDKFVAAQRSGLETGVGDNGALFSGGQRQRLGLARAILRGSELLLLDEATSALDEENERQVLENLSASGKAVLLVTHRLHTQTYAQRVFRIQEGYLVEESPQQMTKYEQALPVDIGY
jgi:ABC-type bacteriocin/lantibiotic exporter with double-glycine peptidase domain